jgi:DNA ligase D-like protein (predicted ligase)/DNA ligase D-like protein (predicted 3'-phosphoesterase)
VDDPAVFNIENAVAKVTQDGDAWEGFDAYAVAIHTMRPKDAPKKTINPKGNKHKSPEQLEAYARKRDFERTPEPAGKTPDETGSRFVVHRHHASRLHYDLRLEQDGVLRSWAVPKGLPPFPGVKRLAVQTEDHPIEYLKFDGKIPKGQYGAGEMWIYALGRYQITKDKKDGFYFRLNSKEVTGEYRIHKMKDKEWLLERVDDPQVNYLHQEILPMLSEIGNLPPNGSDFVYEIKWDGIRALISVEDEKVVIKTRNQNDVTAQFPELQIAAKAFRATNGLFDAEIVCLDEGGKPVFKRVINRLMSTGESNIQKLSKQNPVYCYVFDCLYLDGRTLINDPLLKRKEFVRDAIKAETPYRVSEHVDDGESLLKAAKEHDLEGIIAKKRDSRYLPGRRSDLWLKVKLRQSAECCVIGYTQGRGTRSALFGALHIAERIDGALKYRGKVGTGFDDQLMKDLTTLIKKRSLVPKPKFVPKLLDDTVSKWIDVPFTIECSYAKLTPDKIFREPVFQRLRLDLEI